MRALPISVNAKRFLVWRVIKASPLPLPISTIAAEAGLSPQTVHSIVRKAGWRFLPEEEMTFLLQARADRVRQLPNLRLRVELLQ